MNNTPNYDINYEDERFKNVETEKNNQLNEINTTYNNMINQSEQFYQNQIDAANDYANKQQQLQQERTDFTIEQINQNKEKEHKDYIREQKGAYVDWQKQSNQYGANAEAMATNGLNRAGYSESSQVSMYNTYQNRVSTARETYKNAVLNYDNAIKDAQLQNNSALAEIAYNALKTQLELSLQGFQYKNSLVLDQIDKKQNINDTYYARYKDVVNQINTENSLKENVRQYESDMAFKKQQADREQANWEKQYQLAKQKQEQDQKNWEKEYQLTKTKVYASNSGGSSSISKSSSSSTAKSSSSDNIVTNYYNGKMTNDQKAAISKYGAISSVKDKNGVNYQPKGVIINGKDYGSISKTGSTAKSWTNNDKITNSSGVNVANQNVWMAVDSKGVKTYWIWNGSKMTYENIGRAVQYYSNGG